MNASAPPTISFKTTRPPQRAAAEEVRPRERPRRGRRTRRRRFIPALLHLIDAFLPPSIHTTPDPEVQRRGRLLVAASFGFFVISLFFGIQMSLVNRYPFASELVMYAGCLFSVANLFLLRLTRSTALPGALLCLESLAINAFQAYNDLGLDDPVLLWTLVIPWLAAFLVGPSYGFVFGGLVALVNGGFYLLERSGHVFPDFSGAEEYWFFYFLCAATLALFLGFLGWLYEGQTLRNLRTAHHQLELTHADLQRSQARTKEILESITDGFFALDSEWKFTDVNRQAEVFLKQHRYDLLGRNAWDYFSSHLGTAVRSKLLQASQTGIPVEFDAYFASLNRWFEVHAHPFADGLSVYFSDITERKEYEKRLIAAKEEAEQLAEIKTNLMANMSHEIRTPLTSVIGFASILEQEATGEHQEFAQLIGQNGRRLMETLNSVLDLAKLERGAVEIDAEVLNIGKEVEEIARLLLPLAQNRGLELRVEIDDASLCAILDRALLGRVLNNLIGNAIKFTHEGYVQISVSGTDEHVQVKVADTGIGISEEFLPHLFEEFRQESTGISRSYEGNGLGLAISRRLVDTMGGAIEVESEKGVGTTFTIWLPRQPKE